MNRISRFASYAWFVVGYTVLVILWGAVVRATGSGAGCGRHWPTCNGEVIPRAPSVETFIELSHRLTSTLAGFLVIILLVWAYRSFGRGSMVRRGALLSFIFILVEGALGAGLVLLELTDENASGLRAAAVALHLLNTFVLLLWMVLTAWAATVNENIRFTPSRPATVLIVGLVLLGLMSSMGAVTALGDTLINHGVITDQPLEETATQHFLVQLRVIHPLLAVAVSLILFGIGRYLLSHNPTPGIQRLTWAMFGVIGVQMLVGLFTIVLRAPVFMQITHLLLADTLWIISTMLVFEVLYRFEAAPARQEAQVAAPA